MNTEIKAKTARDYEIEIINQLEKMWSVNLIKTRFDVVSFCLGYYGSVTEPILEGIVLLYVDGFINA